MEANNVKAMREALVALSAWAKVVKDNPKDKTAIECAEFVEVAVKEALAASPRNCDVGTADEQEKRFSKFCGSHADPMDIDGWACDWRCPLYENHPKCKEAWEQMPYESEVGK